MNKDSEAPIVGRGREGWSYTAKILTCLGDTDEVAILHPNGDRLPLDRTRFRVPDLIDDLKDFRRNSRLVPGT